MKVSAFTFLRNGQKLGYPFVESIRSVLPIVDEFVVALGPCDDDTERMLRAIGDPKIRIIPTQWNERIKNDYSIKGFVYGQQKSIALFNCTGDWAFYLEGDEIIHESGLAKIRAAMEQHLDDPRIEALAFDYLHFYDNANTIAWSPRWYRSEVRILRNTIPAWGPKGLFFVVLDSSLRGQMTVHLDGDLLRIVTSNHDFLTAGSMKNIRAARPGKIFCGRLRTAAGKLSRHGHYQRGRGRLRAAHSRH